jgi:hypothetical protein
VQQQVHVHYLLAAALQVFCLRYCICSKSQRPAAAAAAAPAPASRKMGCADFPRSWEMSLRGMCVLARLLILSCY